MSTTNCEKDSLLGQTVLPPEPFTIFRIPGLFLLTLYKCFLPVSSLHQHYYHNHHLRTVTSFWFSTQLLTTADSCSLIAVMAAATGS